MTGKEEQLAPVRRPAKSAAAFRTISEVATELEVPTHVLRFWEGKFPSIRPLKRGGGRRYYRPEDVELLRRIRSLLYDEGYTIKGAQRLVREGGGRASTDRSATDRSAGEPVPAVRNAAEPAAPARRGGNGHGRPLASDARQELADILGELRRLRDILDRTTS